MAEKLSKKELVMKRVRDLVSDFLEYNRTYDEELPKGQIEELIASEQISVDEIVECFRESLQNSINDYMELKVMMKDQNDCIT